MRLPRLRRPARSPSSLSPEAIVIANLINGELEAPDEENNGARGRSLALSILQHVEGMNSAESQAFWLTVSEAKPLAELAALALAKLQTQRRRDIFYQARTHRRVLLASLMPGQLLTVDLCPPRIWNYPSLRGRQQERHCLRRIHAAATDRGGELEAITDEFHPNYEWYVGRPYKAGQPMRLGYQSCPDTPEAPSPVLYLRNHIYIPHLEAGMPCVPLQVAEKRRNHTSWPVTPMIGQIAINNRPLFH